MRWRGAAFIACAVVLAACQTADDPPRGPSRPSGAENKAEMARVVEQARGLDQVIDVRGVYETSLTTSGQTDLIATVPTGTPPARTEELADGGFDRLARKLGPRPTG